jgi:hypothetical protein
MLIKLTKEELALARQQSTYRWQLTSLTKKNDDRKDTKSTGEKLELIGVIAEMCFAKIFDLPLILTNGIDAGSDFTITDKTIDCKGTDYSDRKIHIFFENENAFKSDLAVMFARTGQEDIFRCCGWISKKEFWNKAEQVQNGTFKVHETELHHIKELWYKLKQRQLTGRIVYEY